MMNYKGYIGKVEFDDEAGILSGIVINTRDVISFQGKSVGEVRKAFEQSVDDYLEWCKEDGVEPEKPYSGKLNIRIKPEIHQQASIQAKLKGISLNAFIEQAITDELKQG